jgi:hypothetical protein
MRAPKRGPFIVLAGVQLPGATLFVAGLMPADVLVEISGIAAID